MTDLARSFPPIAHADARVLIVGSMPGQASLAAREYYAHPRNAFWPIMGTLLGFTADSPYAERTGVLRAAGIALWDVLDSCQRPGSLDSAIVPASTAVNDFAGFFRSHPEIHHVFFNGVTAESIFRKHVLSKPDRSTLTLVRLPSTSPAHAGLSRDAKLDQWRSILEALRA
jgi:double-stranded uracil-DNA glycosylase